MCSDQVERGVERCLFRRSFTQNLDNGNSLDQDDEEDDDVGGDEQEEQSGRSPSAPLSRKKSVLGKDDDNYRTRYSLERRHTTAGQSS